MSEKSRGPLHLALAVYIDGEIISVECKIENDLTWDDAEAEDYGNTLFEYHFADIEAAEDFCEELQAGIEQAKNYEPGPLRPELPCSRCGQMDRYHRHCGEKLYCDECVALILRLYRSDTVVFDKP